MKYLKVLYENRQSMHNITIHKLKASFANQIFGLGWAIINPLVYILSFWFFFAFGLKESDPILGIPFIMWLFPGILAYRQVSGYMTKAPNFIVKNKVLVKTIKFPVMTLPVIEILQELYIHVLVMVVMFGLYALIGLNQSGTWAYLPDIYYLNFIYYWFAMLVFGVGVSLVLSPLGVLIKDTRPLMSAIMQPMFWITPVLYTVEGGLSPTMEKVQMLGNPLYFFVAGYRDTMAYNRFFFEQPLYDLYFWFLMVVLYLVGFKIWTKTRELMPDLI
ncbi:ABC transporter permease [Mollicutes bacterium LVI A0078]|nr:ABC transporter permease [Mollicutes bacterium LVI A0075]WOO90934.1 ABC transporter permease [Mollicutes bacterium LVI A0078]